jgi:low affinity Fe/Cu permease
MLDFNANAKKPYGSRTLEKLFTLAHKVIHSFCAKAPALFHDFRCLFFEREKFSQWNQGTYVVSTSLLTILSTNYVQNAPTGLVGIAKYHDTDFEMRHFRTKLPFACFLRRINFFI